MNVRKRMVNPKAPQMASYHQGPILTNGALEFVYEKPVTWPIYTLWGDGIRTMQQFNVVQRPQLYVELSLTEAPIYGAGVPAGGVEFQGLIDPQGGTVIEP